MGYALGAGREEREFEARSTWMPGAPSSRLWFGSEREKRKQSGAEDLGRI